MAKDLFFENLKSLRQTHKALAGRIEKSLSISREIETLTSKSGMPTVKLKGILLHSLYDPKASAARMLDKYDLKDKELVIIFGFGLGYHVLEAAKKIGQKTKLLIIEPQLNLFRLALKKMDLSFLLSNEQVRFFVDDNIPGLVELFNDEQILSANLILIEHPASSKISKDYFRYVKLLLSGGETHRKKREGIKLAGDDLLQLLIEGMFFKNWPDRKIRLRHILTSPRREYKRILVIQLASIGDVVYTTPVFLGLKEKFKNAQLFFLTEKQTNSLVASDPHLDGIITFDKNGFLQKLLGPDKIEETKKNLRKLIEGISSKGFDLIINLHTSPRSAVLSKVIGADETWGLSLDDYGVPCVIGHPWMHYKYWTMKQGDTGGLGIVELHLLMANVNPTKRETSIYVDEGSRKKAVKLLESHGIIEKDKPIGLFPGSNYPSRRWSKENFAALGNFIQSHFGARVIIFGGPQDTERADWIAQSMETPPINLAGKASLLELAALLKKCTLLVTNDTGPLHIACAVKTPSITLAGPAWIGPYGSGHLLLVAKLPCIGCPKFICSDHACMELITPEAVILTIEILKELHKGVRNEAILDRLTSHPALGEIEIFYSGDEPPGKLFSLNPLVKIGTEAKTAKEAVLRLAALNLWGAGLNGDPYFSPGEIVQRLRQAFLIEDNQGTIREIGKLRQYLKEEKPKTPGRFGQISHGMNGLPLLEALGYLASLQESDPARRSYESERKALMRVIETIDGVIELIRTEELKNIRPNDFLFYSFSVFLFFCLVLLTFKWVDSVY